MMIYRFKPKVPLLGMRVVKHPALCVLSTVFIKVKLFCYYLWAEPIALVRWANLSRELSIALFVLLCDLCSLVVHPRFEI